MGTPYHIPLFGVKKKTCVIYQFNYEWKNVHILKALI
jgi:hypothetical protein